jgi:tartrate dehydratase alpha subunit/fumarate hydratase class I-like protein
MYAIEFQTKVRDGVIEIPAQYRDKVRETVRVIILTEETEDRASLIEQLLDNPLCQKGFRPLSRDEVYERA